VLYQQIQQVIYQSNIMANSYSLSTDGNQEKLLLHLMDQLWQACTTCGPPRKIFFGPGVIGSIVPGPLKNYLSK
jgi:hypothetical protein